MENRDRATLLATVTFASFLGAFAVSGINIALPSIGLELSPSPTALGWIPLAYSLTTAVAILAMGRIADIYGHRKALVWGLRAFAAIMLATGLVSNIGELVAMRACLGLASAVIIPTSTVLITVAYPAGTQGRALGLFSAGSYLGMTLGPVLGGVITQHIGWRGLFWATGALAFFNSLMPIRHFEELNPRGQDTTFDTPGFALYGVGLALLLLGFTSLPKLWAAILIVPGVLALALFLRWERRARRPLVHTAMFRDRYYAVCNLAAFVNYAATVAVVFVMSLHLQYVRGLDPQTAGLVLLIPALVQAALSPVAGRMSDHINSTALASIGMAASTAALAALSVAATTPSLAFVCIALAILGTGLAFFVAPITHAVMTSVRSTLLGSASSMLATLRWVGQSVSIGIASLIMSLTLRQDTTQLAANSQAAAGVSVSLAVFATLSLVGTIILATIGRCAKRGDDILTH